MYQARINDEGEQCVVLFDEDGQAMSLRSVLHALNGDDFMRCWIKTLQQVPFEAFCFELPPLMSDSLSQPFIAIFPDVSHINKIDNERFFGRTIYQQGWVGRLCDGDSGRTSLLMPCKRSEQTDYSQVSSFTRTAVLEQQYAFWREAAQAIEYTLEHTPDPPLWVSTAGTDINWLQLWLKTGRIAYRCKSYLGAPLWKSPLQMKSLVN